MDKGGNGLQMLEKLAGNSWWKMAGNRCGFPQEIFGDGFPQAVWKGKQLFVENLGETVESRARVFGRHLVELMLVMMSLMVSL